jgi:hypothetical protein
MLHYKENEIRFVLLFHDDCVMYESFIMITKNLCASYYLSVEFHVSGIIQTMNFADNGRHLADQDYTICMRQEEGEIGHL